jgi:hypothetical protein
MAGSKLFDRINWIGRIIWIFLCLGGQKKGHGDSPWVRYGCAGGVERTYGLL